MTAVIIPSTVRKALPTLLRLRNGLYPEAGTTTFLQEEANRIAAYCVKSWNFVSPIGSVPAAGGASRQRWRGFIHTSSHCRYMQVRFLAMPSNNAGRPYSQVSFTLPGDIAPIAWANFDYGAETDSDAANTISVGQARTIDGTASFDLDPDTDYEVNVVDVDNARTLAVSLFEIAAPFDTDNGYCQSGVVAQQDILDIHRSGPTAMMRTSWKRSAAPLITWSVDLDSDAYTNNGIADNLIDGSTTTVSAASPGFTIDLRYRSTLRRAASGVPVLMRAYCKTTGTTGTVTLKDSGGTILATCTTSSATRAWVSSGAFYLPATLAKYDLHGALASGIGTTTVYAVSLYQIE